MKILIALLLVTCTLKGFSQSFYDLPVSDNAGVQYSLSAFTGRKILVLTLPVTRSASDSAFLQKMDSIAITFSSQVKMIAFPVYEDGYVDDSINNPSDWYRSLLDTGILLSKPVYAHTASGLQQDSLFRWLTHVELNAHFEYEATGPGTIFFINEHGELYGISGPEGRMSGKLVDRISL